MQDQKEGEEEVKPPADVVAEQEKVILGFTV